MRYFVMNIQYFISKKKYHSCRFNADITFKKHWERYTIVINCTLCIFCTLCNFIHERRTRKQRALQNILYTHMYNETLLREYNFISNLSSTANVYAASPWLLSFLREVSARKFLVFQEFEVVNRINYFCQI